ncbi:MAG: DNA replication/repair protein RecF [Firmicutes bacterium]|nr:DNA replication/repair protein RecF [Bacillota bacterium]
MNLKKITLTNFRNYEKESLEFGQGIHFIIGSNGEGKTNFLESIYVLALAKSYKTSDLVLIRHQEDFAKVEATVLSQSRLFDLSMIISASGKNAIINKTSQKKLSDYIGHLQIVSFLPEDMNIIKGSPRERRYFFDVYMGQMDKNYISNLGNYKYVLKQRNELLKKMNQPNKEDDLLLDVITEQLAEAARPVVEHRKKFIQEINLFLEKQYHLFSSKNEYYRIQYLPSIETEIEKVMKSKYRTDKMSYTTNFGPHRDDYDFYLNDVMAKDYASGGEQRTLILTLDMALAEMMKDRLKEYPVILLDDVFSELDYEKQNKLIQYLSKIQAQAIITTTSLHELNQDALNNVKVFHVSKGHIQEEKQHGKSSKV